MPAIASSPLMVCVDRRKACGHSSSDCTGLKCARCILLTVLQNRMKKLFRKPNCNKMALYIFEIAEDNEAGYVGLKMKGTEFADPTDGVGAAHDIMEHARNQKGCEVEGELRAIGALIYVRGYNYFLFKGTWTRSLPEILRYELSNIISYLQQNADALSRDWWKRVRPETPQSKPFRDMDLELNILQIATRMVSNTDIQEYIYEYEDAPHHTRYLQKNIAGLLREGYRQAARRYNNYDRGLMSEVFLELEKDLDKALEFGKMENVNRDIQVVVNFSSKNPEDYVVRLNKYEDGIRYFKRGKIHHKRP